MKIKLRTIYSGPLGNHQPGDEPDFPRDVALSLIAGGFATAVGDIAEPEKIKPAAAVVSPKEDAAVVTKRKYTRRNA